MKNMFWAVVIAGLCLASFVNTQSSKWEKLSTDGNRASQQRDFPTAEKLLLEAVTEAQKFGVKNQRQASTFGHGLFFLEEVFRGRNLFR